MAIEDAPPPTEELEEKSAAELLAEETGRPVEEFEIDEDEYEFPDLDELEVLDPDEVYD
jgi:hypothetical protein